MDNAPPSVSAQKRPRNKVIRPWHPNPRECFLPLGFRIRQIRRHRDLSQTELAKLIYCRVNQISRWERGECEPKAMFLPALAAALKCRVTDFYVYRPKDGAVQEPQAVEHGRPVGPLHEEENGVLVHVPVPDTVGNVGRPRTYEPDAGTPPPPRKPESFPQAPAMGMLMGDG